VHDLDLDSLGGFATDLSSQTLATCLASMVCFTYLASSLFQQLQSRTIVCADNICTGDGVESEELIPSNDTIWLASMMFKLLDV
jgi:hypothetical protein